MGIEEIEGYTDGLYLVHGPWQDVSTDIRTDIDVTGSIGFRAFPRARQLFSACPFFLSFVVIPSSLGASLKRSLRSQSISRSTWLWLLLCKIQIFTFSWWSSIQSASIWLPGKSEWKFLFQHLQFSSFINVRCLWLFHSFPSECQILVKRSSCCCKPTGQKSSRASWWTLDMNFSHKHDSSSHIWIRWYAAQMVLVVKLSAFFVGSPVLVAKGTQPARWI